jgi:bifunctional non-homologous end joining protein LigD
VDAFARLRPMLAVPGRPSAVARDHLHEIKWDGARVLVHLDGEGGHTIRSRSGADVTTGYPELAELAGRVDAPALVDGEVVALDERGAASFPRLQRRLQLRDPTRVRAAVADTPVQLVLFDVLVAHGEVVLDRGLEERRDLLDDLGVAGGRIQIPPSVTDLDRLLEVAAQRGDEGVVSKRRGSRYRPGMRSEDWVKLPFARTREVVVGAWRPEGGGRGGRLGAVIVGAYDDGGGLRLLGGVGSGLAGRAGSELLPRLRPSDVSPFVEPLPQRDARPVAPTVVGSVRHRGYTTEGRLRQPVWVGLRDDVSPEDVRLDQTPGPV